MKASEDTLTSVSLALSGTDLTIQFSVDAVELDAGAVERCLFPIRSRYCPVHLDALQYGLA